MKIEGAFLKSKVAKRIFFLFLLSALLPVGVMTVVSYIQIERYLDQQTQSDLTTTTGKAVRSIIERVHIARAQLEILAESLDPHQDVRAQVRKASGIDRSPFEALTYIAPEGRVFSLLGDLTLPTLTQDQQRHLAKSGALMLAQPLSRDSSCLLLAVRALEGPLKEGQLYARLDFKYLLTLDDAGTFSINQRIGIFDAEWHHLFSSFEVDPDAVSRLREALPPNYQDVGQLAANDDQIYVCGRILPLGFTYGLEGLHIVLGQSTQLANGPARDLTRTFPYILAASMLLVGLLSISQIRRSLVPLERLQEGTQRIAAADFNHFVQVESQDEFQELAESFNQMASQLGAQFDTLSAIDRLDRAILSSLRTQEIIQVFLTQAPSLFKTTALNLVLLNRDPESQAIKYTASPIHPGGMECTEIRVTDQALETLAQTREGLVLENGSNGHLADLTPDNMPGTFLLPLETQNRMSAVLSVHWRTAPTNQEARFQQVRQLGDQLAVALTNAALIEELDDFAWSTITSLARTVDAKSPWTSGHSERVTDLSMELARRMRLPAPDLEQIKKGALLHDIGKIGIAVEILDKPGRLTDQEFREMKRHPEIGSHILSPLKAFSDIVSIVRHHHERFDGRGYPDGLAGTDIPLTVRIVTVADVFDAIHSDRPYRARKPISEVFEILVNGKSSQFDPEVVDNLLHLAHEAPEYLEELYVGRLPNLKRDNRTGAAALPPASPSPASDSNADAV